MKTWTKFFSVLMLFGLGSSFSEAAPRLVTEGYVVADPQKQFLREVSRYPELTVDHVHPGSFEVYGPPGLGQWLQRTGARFRALPMPGLMERNGYPTPEEIEAELKSMAAAYPQISQLYSIGKSHKGRDLWVMKITRQVFRESNTKPEFKYIANMHGDEIVGRELMVRLIRDLLQGDGKDPFITKLLDTTEIHILVSMNPDGAAAGTRGNGRGVDLNRDFPDFTTSDNQNTLEGRQPETQAVMRWQASRQFRLSANFHGGAEVVNYPWDTAAEKHPQDELVKALSLEYARNAPYIGASTTFRNGITNGYAWYEVNGGMQDWSSHWHGNLQITIEVSHQKWPSYSTVNRYYENNRNALLAYIARVHNLPPTERRR